jgi:hypothetical protein
MAHKKIAQNQGDSGRVNLSGSELKQFGAEIGESVEVDVAESPAVAKAMIDTKDSKSFIIVSKTTTESIEGNNE